MEVSGELKRRRDDDYGEIESPELSSPDAKRLRADLFLDILDEEDDAGEQDVASVMRSLEEEIGGLSPATLPEAAPEVADVVVEQPDLGFLFEASDDELGLPPTAPASSDEGFEAAATEPETAEGSSVAETEFGQIWGFDEEINGYDGFEMMVRPENAAADEAVVFDGGLFDYADVLSGTTDFADVAWRTESLPAV